MRLPFVFFNALAQSVIGPHSSSSEASPSCQDVTIPVQVEKTSQALFEDKAYSADVLYALAAKEILVSNSYELSAQLCSPLVQESNDASDTLQLLVHGASFNKNMWDSKYEPERYNWIRRMNTNGYTTLAVDLIGTVSTLFPTT